MSHAGTLRALVAELAAAGVREAVVCPGSRSTPLALAMAACAAIRTRVILDERSAGFFALGLARTSRRPVAIVVTSGTAVANLMPAVVEASLALLLVAYGARGEVAIATVALYRLMSFWGLDGVGWLVWIVLSVDEGRARSRPRVRDG